jgi:hypothetical protein
MKKQSTPPPPPFRLITVTGDGTHPGVDLDRPREIDVTDAEANSSGLTIDR